MALAGASVVINDIGASLSGEGLSGTPAEQTKQIIEQRGGRAVISTDSVADWGSAQRIVQAAMDGFGRVDIVVNNAGILRDVIFHKMTPEDWLSVINVHLNGSFFVSRAAAGYFRAQNSGVYVHMTSTSGLVGNFGQANYSAAKLGIAALSKSIALDMQRYGVRSNCIAPFAWSRMTSSIPAETPEQKARVAKLQQMTPDKNAPLAVFLASDAAAAFTGQVFASRYNELFLMSQSRPVRSVQRTEGWDAGDHRGARCPRAAPQPDPARPQPGCVRMGPGMTITPLLSAFTAGITLGGLPLEVVQRARFLVLDLVGNIVRARHDAESTPSLLAAARALGLEGGRCFVFGDTARYTPPGAALLNGALAHSLDFDDTHAAGTLHPGAPVIPAAIAAGEMAGASGADVLAGIIAGYEVTCRLAVALPAGAHYARGYHPTATCGVFGAAAAAARVFGLDAGGVESALGIALSQSAGSLQFLVNGAWTKRFQVGWAAQAGLVAATLAREGFKGATDSLSGRHGFLSTYAPRAGAGARRAGPRPRCSS